MTLRETQATAVPPAIIVGGTLIMNFLLVVACLILAVTILGLSVQDFGNLGKPVQGFAALILMIPAGLAVYASVKLLRRKNGGRFVSMSLYFFSMVMSAALLLHQWGFYRSFEAVTDMIMKNPNLVLGFPLAVIFFWLIGRTSPTSVWRDRFFWIGIIVAAITALLIVVLGGGLVGLRSIVESYALPATWLLTILMLVFGLLSYALLRLGEYFGQTPDEREAWQGWMMLAPNIIGFLVFFAGPLLLSFYLSFTDSTVGAVPNFKGLQNYADILSFEVKTQADPNGNTQDVLSPSFSPLITIETNGGSRTVIGAKDATFWLSLRNTIMFCLLLVPLAVIPALFLAIILNSKLPGMKFFRAVYFLPSVAAVVGTALIWRWLYDPTIGYFNYIITNVVNTLNGTFGMQIQDPAIEWLTGPGVMLFSMVFLSAWQVIGYNTVLFLAGLQGIPVELYEAAMIDGANKWQQLISVTLPMLASTTFFVLITTIVTGLQVFNEPYALFPSRPMPVSAVTSVFYLYERGFGRFEFGYASSIAWIVFAIIFSITLVQFRLQRQKE